jgi:hypothetical protein
MKGKTNMVIGQNRKCSGSVDSPSRYTMVLEFEQGNQRVLIHFSRTQWTEFKGAVNSAEFKKDYHGGLC